MQVSLEQIALRQIESMTEQFPVLNRLVTNKEMVELTMMVMDELYTKEERELLLNLYNHPVGVGLLNKQPAVARMAAELARQAVTSRMDMMSEEEIASIMEEMAGQ